MARGLLLRAFVGTLPAGLHVHLKVGSPVCDGISCLPGDTNVGVATFAKLTLQTGNGQGAPGNECID